MIKAMCPGSFDPLTLGHYDIISRCASMFDKVYVVVGSNSEKNTLLSREQRLFYARDAFSGFDNIEVVSYDGLTVDFAFEYGCDVIVKGLRNASDLEYENEMAIINRSISFERGGKHIETVYLPASLQYIHTSSSVVRKLLSLGLSVDGYVHNPPLLMEYLGKC